MGRRHIVAARLSGLEIVGITDTRPESLAEAKSETDVDEALHFSDARQLIEATRPECVVIATTAASHAELTCMAAEAGVKRILCEKPMATSLADCDRMIDVCRTSGTRLAINHQMRYMPQFTIPKAIADSPEFGGVSSVTVIAGNFGIAMNGTHRAELLRYMTGEPPRTVTAWFSAERLSNPRGPEFEDRAGSLRVTTGSGRRLYLDASAEQGHGIISLYAGRNGQIVVDELGGEILTTIRVEEHRALPTTRYGMPADRRTRAIPPSDPVAASVAALRALIDGDDYPSGEEGRQAVSVIVAAYLSAENGSRAVDLKTDALPRDRRFPWA